MRRVCGYAVMGLAFLLGAAIAIATVAWDVMWTIDAWPDLVTIIWLVPLVTMTVSTVASLCVYPLVWASGKLLEEPF